MNASDLLIAVVLGTARAGRRSEHPARFVFAELQKRSGVAAEFLDIRDLRFAWDGPNDETRDERWAELARRADSFIIVTPEYNRGYPGLLKHALDMNLEEYSHKPVAFCGVSAGPFGGARVIEQLLPVARELGLVVSSADVNFGGVAKLFGEDGELKDPNFVRRVSGMLDELIWLTRGLKHGRENIAPA